MFYRKLKKWYKQKTHAKQEEILTWKEIYMQVLRVLYERQNTELKKKNTEKYKKIQNIYVL
jgi:aspartate carbamoyltransferase catalytic subunit